MAADQRILDLLRQKTTQCTLRKQPHDLTKWFYQALEVYSRMFIRPDKNDPPVKPLMDQLFAMLKFVALPNTPERKYDLIKERWEYLFSQITALGI